VVAGSTVVGSTAEAPVTGKAADVLAAAYTGAEAILRLVKPGAKNTDIPDVLEKIAAAHGCSVVEGVLSHQMKRFLIDGEKCILAKADVENKVEEAEFEVNEVYHLDVAMSTGDGKTRELD
jgi:methionine aminopeptidase